jgi:hypothetical protein
MATILAAKSQQKQNKEIFASFLTFGFLEKGSYNIFASFL